MDSPIKPSSSKKSAPGGDGGHGHLSGRSKPRASMACQSCRQRKIKCNGLAPGKPCASCTALRITCQVSRDGDRRKTGSREQVAALQERLQQLESMVQNQNTASSSSASAPPRSTPHIKPDPVARTTSDPNAHNGPFPADRPSMMSSSPANSLGTPPVLPPFSHVYQPSGSSQSTPASDAEKRDRESRFELDERRGQTRYYGPTSNLYIGRRSTKHSDDASSHDTHQSAVDFKMDSTPLRNTLLQSYFESAPLSIIVADEKLFYAGRAQGERSEYYSMFLENCILACATRLSTSADVRSLGTKYIERAKLDVADELENANVSSLEGFLLLSDFEATRGRDRVGYLYSGISCRLVFDLGLPENCSSMIADGKMTQHEAMWRHTLLLNTYVFDKLWAIYLGRPSAIPITIASAAHNRAVSQGWDGPANLEPFVGLCTDMSEMTDILNSSAPLGQATIERLTELDSLIQERCDHLPAPLALNPAQIAELNPTAYCLHIQFHGIRIVLHRLLSKAIAAHASETSRPQTDRERAAIEHSKHVLHENAVGIARLVSTYRQLFGIEKVITIMLDNSYIAAALLASNILQMQKEQPGLQVSSTPDYHWVTILAEMLRDAQKHYPVTARMRSTLTTLVEGSPMEGLFDSPKEQQEAQRNNNPDLNRRPQHQQQNLDQQQPQPQMNRQYQSPHPQLPPQPPSQQQQMDQTPQPQQHYSQPQYHQYPQQQQHMAPTSTPQQQPQFPNYPFNNEQHFHEPFAYNGDRFMHMSNMVSWIMPSPDPSRPDDNFQYG